MTCYQVTTKTDDPYGRSINLFLLKEFPITQSEISSEDLLELVFNQIMGTKQHRYGPKPSPEVQVGIREVISFYSDIKVPIPFLVPWGSEKPDGTGIDSAEIGALKTLACLNSRVKKFYAPGIHFNIRIEDVSAPHLFSERADAARDEARRYTSELVQIIKILGLNFITPVPETSLIDEETFNIEADKILPAMTDYISHIAAGVSADLSHKHISTLGWKGHFKTETFNFYMRQYEKLYPGTDYQFKVIKLARYLSGALARSNLKIRGDNAEWNGLYTDLLFVPNPPGISNRFGRRVIYRTLPKHFTSNNIPPWRAKGYLEIDSNGEICPKLSSFSSAVDLDLVEHKVDFKNGELELTIPLSYLEK